LVLHLVLSAIYGVTFAAALALVPALRVNRVVLVAVATLFGLALWLVNFFVIAPVLFEWFEVADDTVPFLAHTFVFGTH